MPLFSRGLHTNVLSKQEKKIIRNVVKDIKIRFEKITPEGEGGRGLLKGLKRAQELIGSFRVQVDPLKRKIQN